MDCQGPLQAISRAANHTVGNNNYCGVAYNPILKFDINVEEHSLTEQMAKNLASTSFCDLSDNSNSYWVSYTIYLMMIPVLSCYYFHFHNYKENLEICFFRFF